MAIEAAPIVRKFVYNGTELPDPNPNLNADEVQNILAATHPELANAAIDGPVMKDGKQTYTFIKSVGTKG